MRREDNKAPSNSRAVYLKSAKNIVLLSVTFFVLMVVINIFAAQLPSQYTHFDTTNIQLYSISDHTKQVVAELDEDVELYLVAQYGKEDRVIQELLQRYDDLSTKVRMEQIDPILQPDRLEQYASSLESNSVIVSMGDRYKVINYSSMYVDTRTYTEESGYVYDSSFAGEQEVTSAIAFVSSEDLPKMYVLTGHGEATLPTYIQQAVERENIDNELLNLGAVDAIPEDADFLLLYAPEKDLQAKEAQAILNYLKNGGRMILIGHCPTSFTNLSTITSYYGIEQLDGTVIERNSNYFMSQYPSYILTSIASHKITQPLMEQGYFVLAPESCGLVPMDSTRDTVQSAPLLYTTDSAINVISADQEQVEADAVGPFTVGLAVEEETTAGTTRLVWFTSPHLLLEDINELASGANYDLFLNTLSWMYDFDTGISIRTKNLMMDYLSIQPSVGTALGIGMTIVLPAVVLAVGYVILIQRRKR